MKVRDDRGVRRRLPSMLMVVSSSSHRYQRLIAWHEYAKYQRVAGSRLVLALQCAGLTLLAAALMVVGYGRTRIEDSGLGYILMFVGVLVLIGGAAAPLTLSRGLNHWRRRARTHLEVCPSCEYEILGLEPDADGCVVCPECGGAWRCEP